MNPDDRGPGGADPEHVSDEEWAELVARLWGDDEPGDPFADGTLAAGDPPLADSPAPAGEDWAAADGPADSSPPPPEPFLEDLTGSRLPPESGSGFRTVDHSMLDDADEGYEPPEPPPLDLSSSSPFVVLAWFCTLGGAAYVLFVVLFWRQAPSYTVGIGIVAFIGGLIGLGLHLPKDHDDDDGAVV